MAEDYVSGEEYQRMKHSVKSTKTVAVPTRIIGFIVAAIVLLGLGFVGGMTYQKHNTKSPVTSASTAAARSGFGGSGGFSRRSGSFGQVTAISTTSITLNNERTGASTTYAITSSTTITDNGQTVATSDIQTGDTVVVMTSTTDTTTATSIVVNPSFGGGATTPSTTTN